MGIAFTPDDWAKVKQNYTAWWNKTLERPIVSLKLSGRDPGRSCPSVPLLTQENCTNLQIPAADLIDRIDYELSTYEYLGDSFPFFSLGCFGPGVVAAFLGATPDNHTGKVWFHPKEILPIEEIHFEYDPNNIWLNRIKDICYEGTKRWQGQVILGMPDLGGGLDILSIFRPGENFMFDLYDDPEEVQRLLKEIDTLWMRYYNEIAEILQSASYGFSDWSALYSPTPSYILQSDASYMISPQMFDEFVKPSLTSMCQLLDHTIYHMDGIGQLNHMDSLLSIEGLDAIQWVPGDGHAPQHEWPDVQSKLYAAGKNLHIYEDHTGLDHMISYLGSGKGVFLRNAAALTVHQKNEALRILDKYDIE